MADQVFQAGLRFDLWMLPGKSFQVQWIEPQSIERVSASLISVPWLGMVVQ
jgi:hypothetical protein